MLSTLLALCEGTNGHQGPGKGPGPGVSKFLAPTSCWTNSQPFLLQPIRHTALLCVYLFMMGVWIRKREKIEKSLCACSDDGCFRLSMKVADPKSGPVCIHHDSGFPSLPMTKHYMLSICSTHEYQSLWVMPKQHQQNPSNVNKPHPTPTMGIVTRVRCMFECVFVTTLCS